MEHRKCSAAAMAAVLMAAALCCALPALDDREADDSDADPVTISATAIFAVGFVLGACASGAATYAIMKHLEDKQDEFRDALRTGEANRIYSIVETATASYTNSLSNYSQIWSLTSEHWIREAELAASVLWAEGEEYSPQNVMAQSGIYSSSAMMLANAVAEPNAIYSAIAGNIAAWVEDPTYNEKIVTSWVYGPDSLGSGSSWSGTEVWAAAVPASASEGQEVYVGAGGYLECFGGNSTAAGPEGIVTLPSGTQKEVPEGIYTLAAGATYVSDRMLPVIAPDSASVVPGIIMSAGGAQRLALYDPSSGKVSVGGTSYDGIGISIKAAGGDALTVSMTGELERRHGLMSAVASTMGQADGSAWAVWQIFTDAGSASAYLTTLSVPNEYEDIGMTASQKRIMAVLSLQELAGYWNSTGGSLLKEYKVTGGSNALFIRGDIMDGQGNTVAKDAVFTPYYRVNDDRIELGSNTQHQAATVAVWASGYTGTLSAWGRSTDSPFLITSQSGYVFDAAEIEYGGESVSSADLDVRQIDYIDPEKISVSPTPTPPAGGDDWTKMIIIAFIVLAVLLAFTGITHGRPELVVIGIIAAAVGIAGADTINGWIVDGFSIGGLLG